MSIFVFSKKRTLDVEEGGMGWLGGGEGWGWGWGLEMGGGRWGVVRWYMCCINFAIAIVS